MKYLNCSNHQFSKNTNQLIAKWISLLSLIIQIELVVSSNLNNQSSNHHQLNHHQLNSWPIEYSSSTSLDLMNYKFRNLIPIRSKRNLNAIFVDLETDQSIYHHPSPIYNKIEFGQSDYWTSIKRKWQQSELCPCQCIFDHLNRKLIKCDEQLTNLTSIPTLLDPNVEVNY